MAISALGYEPPVRRSVRREPLDYGIYETAVSLAESGRPREALAQTLAYLFPKRGLADLESEAFTFTQGSSRVTTRIEGDDLVVAVPLVRLPAGGSGIAAMRYILSKISSSGQLYQPRLAGDDVRLEFRDALARFHPAKLLEVMKKMPAEADENDDFLIGQFAAAPIDRAPIDALDDAELARAESIWRMHWNDVDELLKEARRKRSLFFLNELTAWAHYRPIQSLPITGFLRSRLDEGASTFNDTNEDAMKREAALAKTAKEMKAVTRDELAKSLGHATYAVDPLSRGTAQVLDGHLGAGDYRDRIDELRGNNRAMDAALALVSTYTFLLAQFSWSEDVENALQEGLASASGKPWREAAEILADHARDIADELGDDEEEDGSDEDEAEDDE